MRLVGDRPRLTASHWQSPLQAKVCSHREELAPNQDVTTCGTMFGECRKSCPPLPVGRNIRGERQPAHAVLDPACWWQAGSKFVHWRSAMSWQLDRIIDR